MFAQILATKLYAPPPGPQLIARPRLTERLNQGFQTDHKLTLIAAPPGFGKTTLLSEWIHVGDRVDGSKDESRSGRFSTAVAESQPARVAWVSLDEHDNDPVRFWSYVISALDKVEAGLSTEPMTLLHSPQAPPIETILTILVNSIIDLSYKFTLVLDDYHLISAEPIHQALTFLLEHLPPQLHLVLTSRTDPPLPLTRLRVRGQLTELREGDLRFTLDEAVAFLNQMMGLNLSPAEIMALEARTEGWVAGLQLAALSLQGDGDASDFVQAFTGSHRYVIDYLAEEVLNRQPVHIQTFLLQTSILDRLYGPLCDAVLGRDGRNQDRNGRIVAPVAELPDELASGQEILTSSRPTCSSSPWIVTGSGIVTTTCLLTSCGQTCGAMPVPLNWRLGTVEPVAGTRTTGPLPRP